MSIKDSIIDALKEENMKLQSRVQQLEDKLPRMEIAKTTMNNIHGAITLKYNILQPTTVADDHLKNKVIDIFRC